MRIYLIIILISSTLYSNPISNAYSWVSQEYKDFRTYPRVDKAQVLLKEGKQKEAKKLLEKSLEIDNKNRNAINLLLHICIEEEDNSCIEKYSKESKSEELGYLYKKKAQKEKDNHNYKESIKFAKKALNYNIKKRDKEFVELILFESYIKLKEYNLADKLIDREHSNTYNILKWSKISQNMKETKYAYSLAKELPNKLEYLKWKIELLLIDKNYNQASKDVEILNKLEPTKENKKQLLYLYSLTGQNSKILKDYREKLKKGCNRYALKSLLYHYRKSKKKRVNLLKKHYPFNCLKKKERLTLSLELISSLKNSNPRKAKKIARDISSKIKEQKKLIDIYQMSGDRDKLVQIYQNKLNRGCDNYSLYFLLDYYKKDKYKRKKILEDNYPYSCLSVKKQNSLSLELINLLDIRKDREKIEIIISHLNKNGNNKDNSLYLSNLESSLGDYEKSIEYANEYLEIYPNSIKAIKSIGYSYMKLDKKNSALHYFMEASKLNPKDSNLLKSIGYIAIDLEKYDIATKYWTLYLKIERDSKIALELAYLYYEKLNRKKETIEILDKYEKSTKRYSSKYYILKAKLTHTPKKCKRTLKLYRQALNLKKSKNSRYEQIHILQLCKEESKAVKLMEKFVADYPDNIAYQKELAYMYNRTKNHKKAIVELEKIKDKEPKDIKSYTTLAYTYKKNGQKDKAIDTFKEAIDRSKNMSQQDRKYIKNEITNDSKLFHFYLVESARLNSYKMGDSISPINSASYNGFGSMQISYKPKLLPKRTTIYANISHNHKNIKKSIQPSVGIRYKPLEDREIYLSAEQLIKTGKSSRSDTLLRASLGISGEPKSSNYENLYLEGAYFTKENSTILYGNYEVGKTYHQDNGLKITPYITTGATYSNDNFQKKSVTKMDIGVGVAIDMKSGESRYEIDKYRNRLKLEGRREYAGNSKDKEVLRLQWELFY